MDDNENDDNEAMVNVQHLVWLEKLVSILVDVDDMTAVIHVDEAAEYFGDLSDAAKLDLFVYALGCLVRDRRDEQSV